MTREKRPSGVQPEDPTRGHHIGQIKWSNTDGYHPCPCGNHLPTGWSKPDIVPVYLSNSVSPKSNGIPSFLLQTFANLDRQPYFGQMHISIISSIGDIPQTIFRLWSVMHCFKKHMYTVPRAERQRWTANSSMAVTKKGVRRLRWLGFCCDVHLKNPQFGWFEPWHVIFDGSKPMKFPYLRDFSPPLTSYLYLFVRVSITMDPMDPWTRRC